MVLQYAKGSAFDMWDPDESAVTLERHMMDAKRALLDLRPRTRRKCFQDVKYGPGNSMKVLFILCNTTKATEFNCFPEDVMESRAIMALIKGALYSVYQAPKLQQWVRMDAVYEAHTDVNRRHRRGHNHRLLEVAEYVLQEERAMQNSGGLDRRDRVDFLARAVEWYKFMEPRKNSEEYDEKQQALDMIKGALEPLWQEEMRVRVRRHEEFNARP